MSRHRLLILSCACLLQMLPGSALAQRPMTIVDLIDLPVVGTPRLSPDGTQVVYVRTDADWTANKRIGHLWRVRTDGTGAVQLTQGPEGETQPQWSPDGKWLAFVGKRAGAETRADPAPAHGGRRGAPADRPRDGRERPAVVARRQDRVLPRRRAQERRAAGAREGQGRRLRLRRELPAPPPVEDRRGGADRGADHDRRFLGHRLRAVGRRHPGGASPRAQPEFRRRRPERGVGDGRGRRQRRGPDAQRRAGKRRGPVARRLAGAVSRPGQRTLRRPTTTPTSS